jgi:hypothetical protein
MHRHSPCPHCLRRKLLLWASAFLIALASVGTGSSSTARVDVHPELVQTASR